MNKKRIAIFVVIVILIISIGISVLYIDDLFGKKATKLQQAEGITIVPTMRDQLTSDSSWCGTFQLVWNDMKNEVVKKDIVFSPQLEMVENLNKEEFNESMLSDEYYFKAYGLKSLELKKQIEKGIKEKFNQTSDIINEFDWSEDSLNNSNEKDIRKYFFYTMLYRKFDFIKEFDKLKKSNFGREYKDVEYFGIDENTADSVGNQIHVLYYNSKNDFAILINTKTNDEVIFCKSPTGNSFKEIYENMIQEKSKYTGYHNFRINDEFKAPNLNFDVKKEYSELTNKQFEINSFLYGEIEKAMQTIKLTLNEKGGKIKSEAGFSMVNLSASLDDKPKEAPRYFYVDNTFSLFLREKGKEMPYFAARIEDITKFQ
jgi:hypothetical protein